MQDRKVLFMDTRKLRVLLDTIKIKSINKAAEELGYTQSGLTYLLNSLEEELGVPLLVRNRRGVFLSEEGNQLYPHISQILSAEDEMFHALRIIKEKKSDQLVIGSYPSISLFLLPETIKLFQNKYPDTDVDLRVGNTVLNFLLENNEIDFALVSKEQSADFEWEPLFRDPMYAAIPTTNPLAYKNCLTLQELANERIVFSGGNQKNIVLTGMQTNGLEAKRSITMSTTNGMDLLIYVSNGFGVTFLSSMYRKSCPSNVRMIPIDPPLYREVGVISKNAHQLSPQAKHFLYCLKLIIHNTFGDLEEKH